MFFDFDLDVGLEGEVLGHVRLCHCLSVCVLECLQTTVTATDASTNLISTVSGGFHCLQFVLATCESSCWLWSLRSSPY